MWLAGRGWSARRTAQKGKEEYPSCRLSVVLALSPAREKRASTEELASLGLALPRCDSFLLPAGSAHVCFAKKDLQPDRADFLAAQPRPLKSPPHFRIVSQLHVGVGAKNHL